MRSENQAREGEVRTLTAEEIASGVSNFRRFAGWKQVTLAYEARVSERTIQRLERGEKVDDETLRGVAKALKLPEDAFIGPRYIPKAEEVFATVKSTLENYLVGDVCAFSSARDFERILGAHGYLVDDGATDDTVAEQVAEFKELLQDWGDIYSELPETGKLDARRVLLTKVREIEEKGYSGRFGVYVTDDDLAIAVVIFLKKNDTHRCGLKQFVVPRRFDSMLNKDLGTLFGSARPA